MSVGPQPLSSSLDSSEQDQQAQAESTTRLSTRDWRQEFVRLAPGTKLLQEPEPGAPTVAIVDVDIDLEVVDQIGTWRRVIYGSAKAWINQADPLGLNSNSRGRGKFTSDSGRLKRALDLFAAPVVAQPLGPFDLYTNLKDRRLIRRLAGVATHISSAYSRRFGLEPGIEASEAIIIFAQQELYRAFERDNVRLDDLGSHGHAQGGIASLFTGRRNAEETLALFIHELVHLLNRRIFLTPPPPWLEEGMATDLAYSRISVDGRLQLGTLTGGSSIIDHPRQMAGGWRKVNKEVRVSGAKAAYSLLKQSVAQGEPSDLEGLVRLTWEDFVDPHDRQMRYVQSGFLVRYFLYDGDSREAQSFKIYLELLAKAEAVNPSELPELLEKNWPEIEDAFATWLAKQRVPL
jgi:hypothetical protein